MGTPAFAVPTLKALHNSRHDVVLVVTQPDRPRGRGRKIMPPPIKKEALRFGYDIVQYESIKSETFYGDLTRCQPDVIVVVAFGQLISKEILVMPRLGVVNIHASLLPKYRGPAPIQWAIIKGEKKTGVTTMMIDEGMDTGDILLTKQIAIDPQDTSATLHDKLADAAAALLLQTLDGLADGSIVPTPQDPAKASNAPLLSKKDGRIDWRMAAQEIENFIRGVTPWPGAFTFCGDLRLKIYQSRHLEKDFNEAPGTILKSFPDELLVATGNGVLLIQQLQGASGKCMPTKDFLCGCSLEPGTVLK